MPNLEDVVADHTHRIGQLHDRVTTLGHDHLLHQQSVEAQLKLLDQTAESRHRNLAENFAELKNALKWALGLIVSIIISFASWALLQQYNANEAQKKDMQQQIDLLRAQEINHGLRSPQPGAAEAPNPPVGH